MHERPKSYAGRRRPAPRPAPRWLSLLSAALVVAGVLAPGTPATIALCLAGSVCAGAFLALHLHRAAWVVTTGADQELNR